MHTARDHEKLSQRRFGFPFTVVRSVFSTTCLQNYHPGDEQCSCPDFQCAYSTLQEYSQISEHLSGTVMEIGINSDRDPTSRHHDDNDDDLAAAKFCALAAHLPKKLHWTRHPPKFCEPG